MKIIELFTQDYAAATREMTELGGRVTHRLTPSLLLAWLPESVAVEGLRHSSSTPPEELDEPTSLLLEAWKAVKSLPEQEETAGSGAGVRWDDERFEAPRNPENDPGLAELEKQVQAVAGVNNSYLADEVVIGLVIVGSTNRDYTITAAQAATIAQQTLQGTNFLASANPNAKVTFVYESHTPTVSVRPGSFTVWQTSLPDCGHDVTSVVMAGGYSYAGSNGHVYKLDGSGQIVVSRELPGMGNHEVRLCVLGSLLIVGTNGWALGLSLGDLKTQWQTSLPECGHAVTSVFVGSSGIYAGCNSYAYKLDESGHVLHWNGLPGQGNHEVRFAGADGVLYVGTSGFALALRETDFTIQWQASLPWCGSGITNVLADRGLLFAGCNGYVYRLDASGKVLNTNNPPNVGNREAQLASNDGVLYVGTNGFALALSETDLAIRWQTSLPGCKDGITSVMLQSGYVLAGCNGHICELYMNGSIAYTTEPGLGNAEFRFSAGNGTVVAGTNGFALGVAVGNPYSIFEDPWRNAALQQMGYGTVEDFVSALGAKYGTARGYAAFFTNYPLQHFAYQRDWQTVMAYSNDGWGPNAINRVFAHETAHTFHARDEYGSCTCDSSNGYFKVPNKNCVNCTSSPAPCLMNQNTLTLCQWSRGQLGWQYCLPNWRTSLPGGNGVTSVVMAGEYCYAGSNGHVYKLDASGQVVASRELSGMGNHEVRLCVSGSLLIVGTNGWALGLSLGDLTRQWQRWVGGSSVTSVLAVGEALFAGCCGFVAKLNRSGESLYVNNLAYQGKDEVRLASDGRVLYVGTNGWALGLSLGDLTTQWQTRLAEPSITSVLADGGVLFAGCSGSVYRLDASGKVLNTKNLSCVGNHEVRLASDGGVLYVGTNGFVLALSETDLAIQWQTSLPGCGSGITDIVVGSGSVFAGCNGYVYSVTEIQGEVVYTNGLSDIGNNEVRLAFSAGALSIGANGVVVSIKVNPGAPVD